MTEIVFDHFALSVDRALVLLDGGLPRRSRPLLARPHLRIDRVIVEFDGAVHRTAQRHHDDLRRQNALIQAGYLVLRYTASDVYGRAAAIVAEVRAAVIR